MQSNSFAAGIKARSIAYRRDSSHQHAGALISLSLGNALNRGHLGRS